MWKNIYMLCEWIYTCYVTKYIHVMWKNIYMLCEWIYTCYVTKYIHVMWMHIYMLCECIYTCYVNAYIYIMWMNIFMLCEIICYESYVMDVMDHINMLTDRELYILCYLIKFKLLKQIDS